MKAITKIVGITSILVSFGAVAQPIGHDGASGFKAGNEKEASAKKNEASNSNAIEVKTNEKETVTDSTNTNTPSNAREISSIK